MSRLHPGRSAELGAAYASCYRLTKARARNFYYAFLTLPRPKRAAICAVYAFLRVLDDIADGQDPAASEELARQSRNLAACYEDPRGQEEPLFLALGDVVHRYDIGREHFEAVLAGVEMDLIRSRYETFAELRLYCYRVASAVGLICMSIFGYRDPKALDHAVDLGIAMQLTNILRDIPEDIRRDRIYLPREELARFGCSEEGLRKGIVDPSFQELMRFQVERARGYFARSRELLAYLPVRSRACPAVLAKLYERILEEIESRGYDVFEGRISLSTRRKLLVMGEGWVNGLMCW